MKNNLFLYLIIALYLTSNLYSQTVYPVESANMLYVPFTGNTSEWMTIAKNNIVYSIKSICYDGVPIKGKIYLDTLQSPINEVNYWDSIHIVQTGKHLMQHGRMQFLDDVVITDTYISFKSIEKVSVFIVNAFTGDTVSARYAMQPATSHLTIDRTNVPMVNREKIQEVMGISASDDIITHTVAGILSTSYSLPSGVYFAYFVNTDDGKLRWVEKIVKP